MGTITQQGSVPSSKWYLTKYDPELKENGERKIESELISQYSRFFSPPMGWNDIEW